MIDLTDIFQINTPNPNSPHRHLHLNPDLHFRNPALLKGLARGFRWRKLLEIGDFGTIEEIAEAENINPSYVSRVLRMTPLSPEIVEAIPAGRQPKGLMMARAMQPFPWQWQRQVFS